MDPLTRKEKFYWEENFTVLTPNMQITIMPFNPVGSLPLCYFLFIEKYLPAAWGK